MHIWGNTTSRWELWGHKPMSHEARPGAHLSQQLQRWWGPANTSGALRLHISDGEATQIVALC